MHAPGTQLSERSDADLVAAVRARDLAAYGELFARHADAARRLARQLARGSGDAEDLVSDGFAKVLEALRRGGGPDEAFRAYLLTTVRRLFLDRARAGQRVQATDDVAALDAGVPFVDSAVAGFESDAAARAFASLPERWQLVLWHTEVEGARPAEVAPLLGMTPNSVAALAYRAREGLRQAFLTVHAQDTDDADCRRTQALLGGFVRGGTSRRDTAAVEGHLEGCRRCTGVYLELAEVNEGLGALLGPLVLGPLAGAYAASAASAAAAATAGSTAAWTGWLLAVPGRVRDVALANLPATAAVGVATAVVGGGVVTGLVLVRDDATPAAGDRGAVTAPADPGGPSAGQGPDADGRADRGQPGDDLGALPLESTELPGPPPGAVPGAVPTGAASGAPTAGSTEPAAADGSSEPPTVAPTPTPTQQPTQEPTQEPTQQPTQEPTQEPEQPPVTVAATASTRLGATWRVVLEVRGTAPGVLRIGSDRPALALTLDRRCPGPALGEVRCALSEGTYTVRVVPVPGVPTTLVVTAEPEAGPPAVVRVPLTR